MHFTKATANFTGTGNQLTADLNQRQCCIFPLQTHTPIAGKYLWESVLFIYLLLSRVVFGNGVTLPSSQAQTLTLLAIWSHLKPLGSCRAPPLSGTPHKCLLKHTDPNLQVYFIVLFKEASLKTIPHFHLLLFIPPSSVYAHIQICRQVPETQILSVFHWDALLCSAVMTSTFLICKPIDTFIIYTHIHINHDLYW